MKLSELVRYLNYLDQDLLLENLDSTMSQSETLLASVIRQPAALPSFNSDLESDFLKIKDSVAQFTGTINTLKQHIKKQVLEQEPAMYAQSHSLYEDSMIYETNEHVLNRKLNVTDKQREELAGRIKRHTDWRWPGLLFRPGSDTFIEDMVPLDPLYLIDQNEELLQPAVAKFEPSYQRRLRQYIVDDRQPGPILKSIPNNQFGFVFANMFFNFKPLSLVNKYLGEIYQKMRPGGTLIFTYNECDSWQGVDLAERNFMCYTPGHQIRMHAESLGFIVERNITDPANAAWFELIKPGELESIRGGQALAKIRPK